MWCTWTSTERLNIGILFSEIPFWGLPACKRGDNGVTTCGPTTSSFKIHDMSGKKYQTMKLLSHPMDLISHKRAFTKDNHRDEHNEIVMEDHDPLFNLMNKKRSIASSLKSDPKILNKLDKRTS